ncbi:KN motif and ankyrin repeat domain-containing protein 2 [Coregonus clupeaformis]|uniref:KN motif and ankyrin repeat domain-containing protein 2 n=1 Tax=Coregonus clupeaformis TaxID=59861 RepID=UPI001E1C3BB1|nr:KN motif and ankyrin repeat domain-containing protein 2 [Coregonus clupeaformis]XP_041751577.2 KN motif and ankyrin repeat domain-containing protein 2 [Coregonus clupeaformis]
MMDKQNGNGPKAPENGVKGKPPYSVETPYGFHLDLDFLKYVDDIEKGHTIKRVPILRRSSGQRPSTLPRHLKLSGHGYQPSPFSSTGALAPKSRLADPHQGYGSWAYDGRSPASPGGYKSVAEMEASIRAFDEQPLGEHIRPNLLRASNLPLTVLLRKSSTEDPVSLRSSRDRLGGRDTSTEDIFYSLDRSSDCQSDQDFSGTLRRLNEALARMGELEEEVRVIPELKAQICILQEEREMLRLGLNPKPGSRTFANRVKDHSYVTSDLKRPRKESHLFPTKDDVTDDDSNQTHEWRTSTDLDELLTVTSLQAKVAMLEQRLHESSLDLQKTTVLLREQQEEGRRKDERMCQLTRNTGDWVRAERVPVDQDEEQTENTSRWALAGAHGTSIRESLNVGEALSTNTVTIRTNRQNSGAQIEGLEDHQVWVSASSFMMEAQAIRLGAGQHSSETVVHCSVREPGLAVHMEHMPQEEAPPGGMDQAVAALHIRRIQGLLEQQWECLCGGTATEGGKALEHPDPKVNSLQEEMMSLVHTLSSYYNHGSSDGEVSQGVPTSIMKRNGSARLSKNLHFAGVSRGFETTPNEDLDSKRHANEDMSALQQQPYGQLHPGEMAEKRADHRGSNHGDQKEGDPSPGQEMMEGTNPTDETTQAAQPDEQTDSGGDVEAAEPKEQNRTDRTPEETMKAEPDPNTDPKQDREAVEGEFIEACHFVNDHMDNIDNPNDGMRRGLVVLFQHWFRVAAEEDSLANTVSVYLREVRTATPSLLPFLVNMADDNGNTVLHYSVSHTNYPIVSLLLDTGVCDVDLQNKAGYTAVMLASLTAPDGSGDMEVVGRLMELGDVNARASQGGQTALMLAVRHGRGLMVRLLLRRGADTKVQDRQGATALMCACERGHTHIARLLLQRAECDTSIADRRGRTAFSVAQQGSHDDITALLKAHHTHAGTSV